MVQKSGLTLGEVGMLILGAILTFFISIVYHATNNEHNTFDSQKAGVKGSNHQFLIISGVSNADQIIHDPDCHCYNRSLEKND